MGHHTSPSIDMLYSDHHSWLRGWLLRRLGNTADAADLAHDVFLRLIVKPVSQEFDSPVQARSYLRTMANGMCVDLWRRRQIEQAWLDELAARPQAIVPSAEHRYIVLEALQEIDTMLRSLPMKAAEAFVLAAACEMTNQEVADELGIAPRTVRKYVGQAMLHCLQMEETRQVAAELPPPLLSVRGPDSV